MDTFVTPDTSTAKDIICGYLLCTWRDGEITSAFKLSTNDAIRAQHAGTPFVATGFLTPRERKQIEETACATS
jgi:hypothetical protein